MSIWFLAAAALAADIPSVADADLEAALALGGANRPELEEALDWCIQKPYAMQALRFLVGNLPLADLGKISGEDLVAHYEWALGARGEFAYGTQYDDAAWAHFVLPPRVSQEPLSGWRPYLHEQLKAAVADAPTLDEAALRVNQWCHDHARFEQTQRRDQGPLVTLAGGYGRCEELVILYVAACRSVGIPARQAYCPWWAVSDNNHAWAEVLGSDGRWHFVGAAEPAPTLDKAWFEGAVKQAPIIVSPCFGIPENTTGMDVLRKVETPGSRYCLINSTGAYRQTGELNVYIPMPPAKPYVAATGPYWLYVRIFNYGALREVARVALDVEGRARVALGTGDYVLSTNAPVPESEREVLAHVEAGETRQIGWATAQRPGSEVLLSFPPDPELAR